MSATRTVSVPTAPEAGLATPSYYEAVYADAAGDASLVPWADGRPSPSLVNWLNAVAPSLVRCGARVLVVGCGTGEDARELIRRGYDVTAFDCAPSAIEWARAADPANERSYVVADLFDPPARWRHRFDLVVEINTVQALVPERRGAAMRALAELVSPHGHVLVVCRGGETPAMLDDGPPWPLTRDELLETAALAALAPAEPVTSYLDDEAPPIHRIRALLRRI